MSGENHDHRYKTDEDYLSAGYEALEEARRQARSNDAHAILNGTFALMVKMDQIIELLLDIRRNSAPQDISIQYNAGGLRESLEQRKKAFNKELKGL